MNNELDTFIKSFISHTINFFTNRITGIKIEYMTEEPWWEFAITFRAYDYFNMRMNYDRGFFGWIVENGKYGYSIPTSITSLNEETIPLFLEEMKQGIELRIPDEYLKSKGWM